MVNVNRITMESEIINIVRSNNTSGNTFHFIYDRAPIGFDVNDGYSLTIVTRNIMSDQLFLLHQLTGVDEYNCLSNMLKYVGTSYLIEKLYMVEWFDKNNVRLISHFRGMTTDDIKLKFNFSNDGAKISKITELL